MKDETIGKGEEVVSQIYILKSMAPRQCQRSQATVIQYSFDYCRLSIVEQPNTAKHLGFSARRTASFNRCLKTPQESPCGHV
jgi:hypothetical protein